jgi:homoserine O-acetyltransferase/O-succinyltransferase
MSGLNEQSATWKVPFPLESGEVLESITLAYTTYGNLNPARDNVIWIIHALTANANPLEWWAGLVGPGKPLDPERYFIVCANNLGSCYGSTGPGSIRPSTGQIYGPNFPLVTIRDMVKGYQLLQKHLGIHQIALGIGGSMGGQQLLEWAIIDPGLFRKIGLLATNARHSAWGIAFNATQRMAMEADPTFESHHPEAGATGMEIARAIGMLSYRCYQTYQQSQTDTDDRVDEFRASSYQAYQGRKLRLRFQPHAYYALTKAMDSHHVGRGRGPMEDVLKSITAQALVLGIDSDVLFPVSEQRFLAQHIPGAIYQEISSLYGHDGFLVEFDALQPIINHFLQL